MIEVVEKVEIEEFKAKIKAIDTNIRLDQLLNSFKAYSVLFEHYINRRCIGLNIKEVASNCGCSVDSLYRYSTNIRLVCDLDLYKKGNKGYFVDIAEYE